MRVFILCVFLLTGMNAVATDALTQIESRLKRPERVCGAFAQKKVMAHLDAPAQSQGRFCVDKNEGILWRITRPYSSAVKINGQAMIYYRNDQEVRRVDTQNEPAAQMMSRVISSIITQDFSFLKEWFDLRASVTPQSWTLILKPKEARLSRAVSEITLKGNEIITDADMSEKNGNETFTHFFNVSTDLPSMNADDIKLLLSIQ